MLKHSRRARKHALCLLAGLGPKDCSICGAVYSGDHCPNCGWFVR
ncbi:hypothetical protein [Actinomadura miaoliensis]|uniref:Uncharacterized protein n=1 Tax=Actinomadura miaoliensis TaxID=430685 RepID=A0ABP7V5F9_9ACTN